MNNLVVGFQLSPAYPGKKIDLEFNRGDPIF